MAHIVSYRFDGVIQTEVLRTDVSTHVYYPAWKFTSVISNDDLLGPIMLAWRHFTAD